MTQFSLFGAEASDPTVEDVEGLLLAGGRWVRGDAGARVSVVVGDRWRADALCVEFTRRGLDGDVVDAADGWSARTAFAADLRPGAQRWTRGANEGPPDTFDLAAGGLRLWTVAAGRATEAGYLLGTPRVEDVTHRAGGAQLAGLGVPAASVGARGGHGWRISSARRIARLAELVGPPPPGAGTDWPHLR